MLQMAGTSSVCPHTAFNPSVYHFRSMLHLRASVHDILPKKENNEELLHGVQCLGNYIA